MTGLAALTLAAVAGLGDPVGEDPVPPATTFAAAGPEAVQDLLILGERRPLLVRIRTLVAGQTLRSTQHAAARALHDRLDRDRDGKLTADEADAGGLALFGPAPSGPEAGNGSRGRVDPDGDGTVTLDEVSRVLGGDSGVIRMGTDGRPDRPTDALFDHLDRDRNGTLTRPELDSLAGALRRLDRDADEWITLGEVAGAGLALPDARGMMAGRAGRSTGRDSGTPAVIALRRDESPLRVVRLLVRRYDTTSGQPPGRPDGRLDRNEFALPPATFDALDANHDGALSGDELRRYVVEMQADGTLDVAFAGDLAGPTRVALRADDGGAPVVGKVRRLADDLVEWEVDALRVDFQVEPGTAARESARRRLHALFQAADTTQDGYLDADEANPDNGQPAPFATLHRWLDRDGDGKVDRGDLDVFLDLQVNAARGRLTLDAADEGRALLGLLDPDGDRRLGAREVADAPRRVSACDRDGDGRIGPNEIPHQVHITLTRGDLPPLGVTAPDPLAPSAPRATPRAQAGPAWFRKMDRNHDGDVSRREFLGSHAQFDRLDLDHDGLLAPTEADAASGPSPP